MIVVTGGAGFIGSNVVAALTAKGDREIAVCDVFGKNDKWMNLAKHELAGVISPPDLMDFLNSESFRMEAIVHLGAVTDTTETDVDLILRNNFKFSMALWDWCARNEAAFIYASSAATYGDGRQGFEDSDNTAALSRLRPLNPYGWSKHLFDRRVARIMAERLPAPEKWAGLKFFNVYGPNEYHKGRMSSVALQEAAAEVDACEELLMSQEDADTQMRYAQALSDFADVGGYDAEVAWDVCCTAALGAGYDTVKWRPLQTLSGGEQKRLVL